MIAKLERKISILRLKKKMDQTQNPTNNGNNNKQCTNNNKTKSLCSSLKVLLLQKQHALTVLTLEFYTIAAHIFSLSVAILISKIIDNQVLFKTY